MQFCLKENRLARNPKESGIYCPIASGQGPRMHLCRFFKYDYHPDSDHMISQIHFMMANQFSRNLSSDVRRGLEYKAKEENTHALLCWDLRPMARSENEIFGLSQPVLKFDNF